MDNATARRVLSNLEAAQNRIMQIRDGLIDHGMHEPAQDLLDTRDNLLLLGFVIEATLDDADEKVLVDDDSIEHAEQDADRVQADEQEHTEHTPHLGANLYRLRMAAGWNQDELAERSNVSVVTIARAEIGDTYPRRGTIDKLATALNVPPEQIDPEYTG